MGQLTQSKKVKLYHVLKVIFYLLGLPLFFFAVCCSAIKFIGIEPFVGMANTSFSSGVFVGFERFITAPALYGIWCAFAIWVFLAVLHFVLSKYIKNGKARMISMIAIVLVIMLGTVMIMDVSFDAQIDKKISCAPDGVTVQDYKSQLSYYDYVSYGRQDSSLINVLKKKVNDLEQVYNIKWQGIDKTGVAGNISSKPVTYDNIISDPDNDGVVKIGIEKEGIPKGTVIRVAPDKKGQLVIDGKVYSHYFCVQRTSLSGEEINVWYSKDLMPSKLTDGIYGKGMYNTSGMLADGWIFSFENMLEILEDVYSGQDFLAGADADVVKTLKKEAEILRDGYYSGELELPSTKQKVDAYISALYSEEVNMTADFSMPRERLEYIVSQLGGMLGDNALFDYVFGKDELFNELATFFDLTSIKTTGLGVLSFLGKFIDAGTINIAKGLLGQVIGAPIDDIYVKVDYKNLDKDYLVLRVNTQPYSGDEEEFVGGDIATIEFVNELQENGEYKFNLDKLSDFINNILTQVMENDSLKGIVNALGGVVFDEVDSYKGLRLGSVFIPLFDGQGTPSVDITGVIYNLLKGFYSYQSPAIKPVWEFYSEAALAYPDDAKYAETAKYLADYERAYYEATVYGNMIGSTLIGETIGNGSYSQALGLTDLASVLQLKSDLSYQPKNFPLYAFRDVLLIFSGIVAIFYLLYFVADMKEKKYIALLNGGNDMDDNNCDCVVKDTARSGGKPGAVRALFDKVAKAASADTPKASRGRKIVAYVLYALAPLPLLIAAIVIAARSTAVLPSYGGMQWIVFFIVLALCAIYAAVLILIARKKEKSSVGSQTTKMAITFVCLTTVFGLLLTYVLPDPIAKATSSTMWVEDMFYNGYSQVEENAALEKEYIMLNLLNGNLNKYDQATGKIAENGDFSYKTLNDHTLGGVGFSYTNPEIDEAVQFYADLPKSLDEALERVYESDVKAELYEFIYNNYVLRDFDYALKTNSKTRRYRHAVAIAITDYLFEHAGYEKLIKDGFRNKKVQELFANNYDSFNQDGYQTFDDSLLLLAQMDGRMTMPVIVRLLLNKGWTASQGTVDENGKLTYGAEGNFLYEQYDPDALTAYKQAYKQAYLEANADKAEEELISDAELFSNEEQLFPNEGELVNADGKKMTVRYGFNDKGWQVYANGIVKRPINWMVLDMMGDPMELADIDLSDVGLSLGGLSLDAGTIIGALPKDTHTALGDLLEEDVPELLETITGHSGLNVYMYIDDSNVLQIGISPNNIEYGMLGYMHATWVQSNGLLMAVINLMSLRNYLFIFAGIGILFILLAGVALELDEKRVAACGTDGACESTADPET